MTTATLEHAVTSLEQRHDKRVLAIASMSHLCKRLLSHYGQQHGIEMAATIKTLDRCIESHLIENDLHPHALTAAMADLQQAGITAMGDVQLR
jgi:hypothetical protein